jgi:hypothetical protein
MLLSFAALAFAVSQSPDAAELLIEVPPASAAPAPSSRPPLPPPTKPRLLVLDIVDKGAGAEITSAINQAVQGQAVQSHFGETVTATQIKIALDAAANQAMTGCESEACMTDIGKTVEASVILGGSVAKVGADFLITLTAVNARDGSRLGQQQRKVPGNRELYYYAARQLTSLVLTGRAVDPRVPVQIAVSGGEEATIIVDGEEAGTAAQVTVQLDPGSHEIRVRQAGMAEWKTIVTVEEATPLQVTADLVSTRLQLWPVALATGAGAVVVGLTAAGFGIAAQDDFDGSYGIFNQPANSYSKKEPIDSQELFTLQQNVERNALTANVLYGTAGVLAVATAALFAADLIFGASAE